MNPRLALVCAALALGAKQSFARMHPATDVREDAAPARGAPAERVAWTVETADGFTLHGESFGAGSDLLFVHGGPSFPPLQMPEWLVELSARRRVHLFHQRGSGRSSRLLETLPPDEERARAALLEVYGLDAHLRDVGRVLDERLVPGRPVTLVGHSFGAYLAALFAAENPERVGALVLLAPADVLDGTLVGKPVLERIAAGLTEEDRDAYRRRLAEFLEPETLAGTTDAELALRTDWFGWSYLRAMDLAIPRPDSYPAMRWAGGCAVAGVFLGVRERGDATRDLAGVRARTLVVHAADDLAPLAVSKGFAAAIPDARLVVIEDTSHFFSGRERETAEEIDAFLRGPR